jgi:threonine synthase
VNPVADRVVAPAAALPIELACAGCGYVIPASQLALRCPAAKPGDDIDHVLQRRLDIIRLAWPQAEERNPFVRYRGLSHAYHRARAAGWTDAAIRTEIERLDDAVARVDGRGFVATPFGPAPQLAEAAGSEEPDSVWVKDETGNVAGSHKARHLFGTLLALRLSGEDDGRRPLAIASCGNAALAAAVVARAADRELLVFVPTDAQPAVLSRLSSLGALVTICERRRGEAGDPAMLRMREALATGAVPFTCQGNENALAIEGGLSLGYEMVDVLRAGAGRLDHLFIQVGGGALASSVTQALTEAHALGALRQLPRIHAVQTRNAHPLARAYERVQSRLLDRLGRAGPSAPGVRAAVAGGLADEELAWAAHHRSAFMWPWAPQPQSVATGILDDETYDWLAVVRGMLATGGRPVLVDDDALLEANRLAMATTGIDVDTTGSAGLAGLLQLRHSGEIRNDETCAVLFTGIRHGGTR